MSAGGSNKAVIAALSANLGIAVLKLLAFLLTRSSSMLAEAIHSAADSGNQVLLLVGAKRSRREATAEHPFGFGRERYVYAFIVSVVLFSVGGLFALYEAYHKAHEVHAHPNDLGQLDGSWWWVPLVVLVGGIVMEGFSFRTAIGEANRIRGKSSWAGFIRRAKAPELPVVLLEDAAALLGLVFALFGVGLTLMTRKPVFDVIGTALIGLLLVCVAVILAMETKSLLLGESAAPDAQRRIVDAIAGADGVERVIHLKTLHLGPEELLVAAKIGVHRSDSAADVAAAIDRAEAAARDAEPMVDAVYLEPDLARADYVPAERPEQPPAAGH